MIWQFDDDGVLVRWCSVDIFYWNLNNWHWYGTELALAIEIPNVE